MSEPVFPQYMLGWLDRVVPAGSRLPISYFTRAADLLICRQSLTLTRGVRFPLPPDAAFALRRENNGGYVNFGDRRSLRKGGSSVACVACGRPGYSIRPDQHYACSTLCLLAVRLFHNDIQAVLYRKRDTGVSLSVSQQLRFCPPNMLPGFSRQTRMLHYFSSNHAVLTGHMANAYGFPYLSSLYLHPVALRRCLKRAMAQFPEVPPNIFDDETAAPAAPSSETPAPPPSPASPPASPSASPPPPAPSGVIGVPHLSNPVSRRMAEIVLGHLETANDFLSSTRGPTKHHGPPPTLPPGTFWSRDQVTLFLGLLNRTIPAISASINLTDPGPQKDPSEMTREELEAAAQKARTIPPAGRSKMIDGEQQ